MSKLKRFLKKYGERFLDTRKGFDGICFPLWIKLSTLGGECTMIKGTDKHPEILSARQRWPLYDQTSLLIRENC